MSNLLNFHKPETPGQWLVFIAAMGIILSSPAGTRAFFKELNKYLEEERGSRGKKYKATQLSQALYYLKKRKIIKIVEMSNGETRIELTEKGRRKKIQYDLERLKIPSGDPWDGKWRVLMFDIPESKRTARETLRRKLKDLGFIQFQRSVWIYPYPCQDEIDFVTEYFSVAEYVNLITAKMENDKPLRAKFKL